jgi:hypothetical protein
MTLGVPSKFLNPRFWVVIIALHIGFLMIFLLHQQDFEISRFFQTSRVQNEEGQHLIPSDTSLISGLEEEKGLPVFKNLHDKETLSSATAAPTSMNSSKGDGNWEFDTARDSEAWDLTEAQCNSAFPGLFSEIDRAAAYRKSLGQVRPEEIDISSEADVATGAVVRVMIKDQRVLTTLITLTPILHISLLAHHTHPSHPSLIYYQHSPTQDIID